MVNTLTLTYESKVTPAFVPNFNKIPYGGYMHTMFNNKLVQLVNYTNCYLSYLYYNIYKQ